MTAKIYLYSRVSSGQQIEGHGLDRQSDNNNRDAKRLAEKYGLLVSDPITDAGFSAYKVTICAMTPRLADSSTP